MSLPSKPTVFFDENTIIAEKWSLKKIANAARRSLPCGPDQHIFIKLDHFMDSHLFFLVILASTPNAPLRVWKVTVIDEDAELQFERLSIKESK